jgi:hypothetical protein
VAGDLQVKAKLVFILLLSLPPVGLTLALIYYIFQLPLETLVFTVPGIVAYLIFSFCTGIFIDLKRPYFSSIRTEWQNNNIVIAFVVQTFCLAVVGLIAWTAALLGMSPFAVALLVIELVAAADLFILPRLFRYANRRYLSGIEA